MRRTLTALTILLATSAHAEGLVVAVDPGVYLLSGEHEVADPTTTSGKRDEGGTYALAKRTTLICARLHTSFGVRFSLSPVLGADSLPVDVAVVHPSMTNHAGQAQDSDHLPSTLRGQTPRYYGWTFEDPTKLLPGRWHIVVSHGGQVLADQPFDVDFTCSALVS